MTSRPILFILLLMIVSAVILLPTSAQAGIDCGTVAQFWAQIDPNYAGPSGLGTYDSPFRTESEAIWAARSQRAGGCVYVVNGSVLVKDVYYVGPYLPDTGAPLSLEATYALMAALALALIGSGWWLRQHSAQPVPIVVQRQRHD